ncbi:hypothetical protein GQ600_21667 [Phytophthora cactorum]|nr:hypothetical protein GQ600_21667 [Phytophthora cactorum]
MQHLQQEVPVLMCCML